MKLNYAVDYTCKTATTDVTHNEFRLITECIANNDIRNYLEIGVWHGATLYSVVKLFKLNGVELNACGYDCFEDGAPADIENSHTSGWPSMAMVSNTLKEFSNVTLVKGDAGVVDKVLAGSKFDFVFHDANHTKDAIVNDLLVLKNVLNEGAYVLVHNSSWDEPHRNFYGRSAVDYLVSINQYVIIDIADTAVLLRSI